MTKKRRQTTKAAAETKSFDMFAVELHELGLVDGIQAFDWTRSKPTAKEERGVYQQMIRNLWSELGKITEDRAEVLKTLEAVLERVGPAELTCPEIDQVIETLGRAIAEESGLDRWGGRKARRLLGEALGREV